MQKKIEHLHLLHTRKFQDEADADEIGKRIVLEHLAHAGVAEETNTCMCRLARGIFAVAMFTWHLDLRTFFRALGEEQISDMKHLSFIMARSRQHYIRAASLFGEDHRFTLLRAALLIEALLRARSNVFAKGSGPIRLNGGEGAEDEKKLREVVARYGLLCAMMDTAVKIAYVGASMAWLQEADNKRGSGQLLLMKFESVAEAMDRLKTKGIIS